MYMCVCVSMCVCVCVCVCDIYYICPEWGASGGVIVSKPD